MNILVIAETERPQEPHKQVWEPVGSRLIRAGHNVRSTWYGQTGINLFTNASATSPKFDLVIVGWQMIDMTGEEVLQKLRDQGSYTTKTVLLTDGFPDIDHFKYRPDVRFDTSAGFGTLCAYIKAIELMPSQR